MLDNKNIQFTGLKTGNKDVYNTIMNGEYMKKDKQNNFIYKYLAYDLYYSDDKDYSELPLMKENKTDKNTRLMKLKNIVSKIKEKSDYFNIEVKTFYITNSTNTIFEMSKLILEDDIRINYKLDGLIYTPSNYPVGYDEKIINKLKNLKINMYDVRVGLTWFSNLKWKPIEDNSIDFKINIQTKY